MCRSLFVRKMQFPNVLRPMNLEAHRRRLEGIMIRMLVTNPALRVECLNRYIHVNVKSLRHLNSLTKLEFFFKLHY